MVSVMQNLITYTVVGIYPETDERYLDFTIAPSPDAAEDAIRARIPELLIAAVFEGKLTPVDTKIHSRD